MYIAHSFIQSYGHICWFYNLTAVHILNIQSQDHYIYMNMWNFSLWGQIPLLCMIFPWFHPFTYKIQSFIFHYNLIHSIISVNNICRCLVSTILCFYYCQKILIVFSFFILGGLGGQLGFYDSSLPFRKKQQTRLNWILIMGKIRNTFLTINKVKQERDKDINRNLKLLKL